MSNDVSNMASLTRSILSEENAVHPVVDLILRAQRNWDERNEIVKETQQLLSKLTDVNNTPFKEIPFFKETDPKFLMKLFNFPGDITTHRISNTLSKTLERGWAGSLGIDSDSIRE